MTFLQDDLPQDDLPLQDDSAIQASLSQHGVSLVFVMGEGGCSNQILYPKDGCYFCSHLIGVNYKATSLSRGLENEGDVWIIGLILLFLPHFFIILSFSYAERFIFPKFSF